MNTLKTIKKTHEVITAEEYVKRYEKRPESVSGAQIISPKIGSKQFGLFKVEREKPLYEVILNER